MESILKFIKSKIQGEFRCYLIILYHEIQVYYILILFIGTRFIVTTPCGNHILLLSPFVGSLKDWVVSFEVPRLLILIAKRLFLFILFLLTWCSLGQDSFLKSLPSFAHKFFEFSDNQGHIFVPFFF